jgi:integrase
MMSFKVRFWAIKTVKNRTRGYGVRWVVEDEEQSEWFVSKALAERYRNELMQLAHKGEAFDTVTGLPESKLRKKKSGTWLDHARAFTVYRWPGSPGNTRSTIADCLAPVTRALVKDRKGAPDPAIQNRALAAWAFNKRRMEEQDPPDEIAEALAWLSRKSFPMAELEDPAVIVKALEGIAVNLDGKAAKPKSIRRRRSVFYSCLEWAVDEKIFMTNPLTGTKIEMPKTVVEVDPRSVPNPDQARALLAAVPEVAPRVGRHLYAFFACMYFAALRPSEVVGLALDDCTLPETGWGRLLLSESAPAVGKQWTDDGEFHETRPLKHRAEGTKRPVPVCPELVVILRAHVDEFGTAADGRLFRSQLGNRLAPVSYEAVWTRARKHVLSAVQLASPLAATPYDLRHACLSLWLNSGVPGTNVAAWAGHSLKMLQSTYAHCIDGDEAIMAQRIEDALATSYAPGAEHAERNKRALGREGVAVPRLFREQGINPADGGSQRRVSFRYFGSVAPAQAVDPQVNDAFPAQDVPRLHSTG